MKESATEKALKHFIATRYGWGQKVQSGSLMVAGKIFDKVRKRVVTKEYKVNLCDRGTPDTMFCVPKVITQDMVGKTVGLFVGVEVKKSATEVKKWKNLQARYLDGEDLPGSYEREKAQIKIAERIKKAGGKHYVVGSLVDFIDAAGPDFDNFF